MLPDFTIVTSNETVMFCKHAGLLELPESARKREHKKRCYAGIGVLPHEPGVPNGGLMWTEDLHGANAEAWRAHACEVLDVPDSRRRDPEPPRRARTTLKPQLPALPDPSAWWKL